MKINLSVIIPVYEAQKTLVRTINSINNQFISDKNLKVELILIIDDGKKYNKFLDKILDWTNEIVLYEEYNFKRNIPLRKHPDRKKIVSNDDDLKEIYNEYAHTINTIENDILLAKAKL